MHDRNAAFAVLGGSIYTAFGFVSFATNYFMSSNRAGTGLTPELWASTIVALALGFVVILSGYLMASEGRGKRFNGGIAGVTASLAAPIVALIALTSTVKFSSTAAATPQLGVTSELLFFGTIIALFIGFPLSMFGTVGAMTEARPPEDAAETPAV